MSRSILVFYGSYRRDRQGIKLADYRIPFSISEIYMRNDIEFPCNRIHSFIFT